MGNFMWNMGMTGFGHVQSSIFPGGIGVPSFPKKKKRPARNHSIESPEEESPMEQPEDEDLEEEEQDFSQEEESAYQEEGNSEYGSASGKEYNTRAEEEQTSSLNLQEAVVWAEILGDPVSRKRRKKRAGQLYGNQGYVGRR